MNQQQDKRSAVPPAQPPSTAETAPSQLPAQLQQPQQFHQTPDQIAPGTSLNAPPMDTAHISLPIQTAMASNGNVPFPSQDMAFGMANQGFTGNAAFLPGVNMMMPNDPMALSINGNNSNNMHVNPLNNETDQNGKAMSADEIALYDRQIRLWGMQAQKKVQAANVLIITVKALASEIAKNLVLAGIASLTVLDDQLVTEADLGAQFLLKAEDIGQNRAVAASVQLQKLNPRVKVYSDPAGVMKKGASYFSEFDVVIGTDLFPTTLAFINTATRLYNRRFYAAGSHGLYGYAFCDLIEHDYVLKRDKGNVATTVGPETRSRSVTDVKTQKEGDKTVEMVAKRELYSTWDLASETSILPVEYTSSKRRLKAVSPALSCLRALWAFQQVNNRNPSGNRQDLEFFTKTATQCHQLLSLPSETLRSEFLRSFLQNIGSEIAPVTAILGGQVAQDIINVLGQSQQPIQNMIIFDGNKMEASMYPLHPEGPLGRAQLELAVNPMMIPAGDQQFMAMGQPDAIGQVGLMNPSGSLVQSGQVNVNEQAGTNQVAAAKGQAST